MQKVIYADVLIFINCVITLLILLTASDIIKCFPARKRYIAGAFVGGFLSLLIFLPVNNIILNILIKAVEGILIVFVVFGYESLKQIIKAFFSFIFCSFLYGGIVFAVSFATGSKLLQYNNGYLYFDLSAYGLILMCTAVFFIIKIADRRIFKKNKNDITYKAELYLFDNKYEFNAFLDSGNTVVDRFTGRPVVILSFSVVKNAFSIAEREIISSILNGVIPDNLPAGMRLLPVKTLGSQKLMPTVTAERIIIRNTNFRKIIKKPGIVLSDDSFGEEKFSALINSDIAGEVI